jgi:WD40 repeat protein
LTLEAGGGSAQSAERKAEASSPKPTDSFSKLATGAIAVISAVGTISGFTAGFVKPGLEELLITLAISLAVVLVLVAAIVLNRYRKRLVPRRAPAVAVAGFLILAAGAGIGYVIRGTPGPAPVIRTTTHPALTSSASPSSPAQTAAIPALPYRTFTNPNTTDVTAVALSPDGKSLAASDVNGGAFIWDIPTDSFITGLYGPNRQPVWDIAFSPDGTTVADGTSTNKSTSPKNSYVNGSVYLWNVTSPAKPIATFPDPHRAGLGPIAFSPGGKLLAAADNDGTVYVLDAANLKISRTLQASAPSSGYSINDLVFSRNGSELAGADSNGSLYVWSVTTGTLIRGPLYDPSNQTPQDAKGIAFSPDTAMVAVADTNGSAYLWNLAQKRVARTFHDPDGLQVVGVAFTPDGRFLITTSESGKYNHDSAIRVWNAATGTLIHSFHDPGSYGGTSLALSPDGRLLAVADDDARAYLWSLGWLHR